MPIMSDAEQKVATILIPAIETLDQLTSGEPADVVLPNGEVRPNAPKLLDAMEARIGTLEEVISDVAQAKAEVLSAGQEISAEIATATVEATAQAAAHADTAQANAALAAQAVSQARSVELQISGVLAEAETAQAAAEAAQYAAEAALDTTEVRQVSTLAEADRILGIDQDGGAVSLPVSAFGGGLVKIAASEMDAVTSHAEAVAIYDPSSVYLRTGEIPATLYFGADIINTFLTPPAQFAAGGWSVTTGLGDYQIVVNITALPADNGSTITAIQYTIDGGATWLGLAGVDTGARTLTMAAKATPYTFAIRAVNAKGVGPASASKTATSAGSNAPTPTNARVGVLIAQGNSHMVGRSSAQSSDRFAANVYQWTQAGTLEHPSLGMLDFADLASGYSPNNVTPILYTANQIAAARTDLQSIVIVPDGQGSSGWSNGVWLPTDNGLAETDAGRDRMLGAVARVNACIAYLQSQNKDVEILGAVFINGDPDATSVTNTATEQIYMWRQDAHVDYLRANVTGGADMPAVVSNVMTLAQIGSNDSYAVAHAVGTGVYRRRARSWYVDVTTDRGDGEAANLPVLTQTQAGQATDGIHASYAGEATKGRLIYAALNKAANNLTPHAPFSDLDSWAGIHALYDFRAGSQDSSGNGRHLAQAGSNPAYVRYKAEFGTAVFDRPSGTNRTYVTPMSLPPRYTIVSRFLRSSSIAGAMGIVMNTKAVTGAEKEQRFYISGAGAIVAGNASGTQLTSAAGYCQTVNQIYHLALTYDGSNLIAYVDGVQVASATGVPDPDQTRPVFVGCQYSTSTTSYSPIAGAMQYAAIYSQALTPAQILALRDASYT